MLVRSEESDRPSIVVAEGETFTLSALHSREYPNLIRNLRPRTTAALPAVRRRHRPDCPTPARSSTWSRPKDW
jgi:hypothetical protein